MESKTGSGSDRAVGPEARGAVARIVFGSMAAQTLGAAVRYRLPDLVGEGERTAAELAEECGTGVQPMTRLLRALAALELFSEARPGCFSLTPAGALLQTGRPDSMHALAGMFTDPAMMRAWEHLDSSVRTGETSFDGVFGTDFFAYLKERPELSERFNAAMSQGTRATASVLPTACDFGRFGTVVDVGGGDGTLIAAILREHSHLNGILFDSAEGLAEAAATLRQAGVAERCAVRTGDFFTSVPEGGDAYLLKSVLHDWDDDRAAAILGHCRRVIPEHGRLLIVEPVLSETVDGSLPPILYLSDLNMLVNVGGRERTRADFAELCRRSGFRMTGVTPLASTGFCLIEAEPAAAE